MSNRLKTFVVPVYLFACLVLGGSPQGVWSTLVLQLAGLALLAWAGVTRTAEPLSKASKSLLVLTAIAAALVALQLMPLPPQIWSSLPGRDQVVNGFALLGESLPWLPISLTPYATLDCLLAMIPPVAVLVGIIRLGAYRSRYLAIALLAGTLAGMLLGAVQVTTGKGYLFPRVTAGQATGFFANANYMGTLLLVSVPFVAALAAHARLRQSSSAGHAGSLAIAGSMFLLLLVGLGLSLSLAAVLLMVPVSAASALLLIGKGQLRRRWMLGLSAAGALLAMLAVITLPAFDGAQNSTSVSTREQAYRTTVAAARAVMPVGSGFGSFVPVFARQEDASSVDRTYTNHAHNDYLEIGLEGGVPAIFLLLVGLSWWGRRSWSIWRSDVSGSFARAATVSSAAVLLHSLVDFPARTTAISAVFAMCLALMAEPRRRRGASNDGLERPARHLTV